MIRDVRHSRLDLSVHVSVSRLNVYVLSVYKSIIWAGRVQNGCSAHESS